VLNLLALPFQSHNSCIDRINEIIHPSNNTHGREQQGTGTGAAPIVSEICYNAGILTVGVVTKPFFFEGRHRMKMATDGLASMKPVVDSLLVIPNQNLFKLVDQHTTLQDSFHLADNVLLEGVRGITDLMTSPGLINLDFADVQAVMHGMGNAMLGTGQCEGTGGEGRSLKAADMALQNPLMGDMDISTAKGMLVNITGGSDMTLFEVDQAAQRIISLVQDDENANIIFGSAFDASLEGSIKVSIVATGMDDVLEASDQNGKMSGNNNNVLRR
jgi:cell division protein FtsZ